MNLQRLGFSRWVSLNLDGMGGSAGGGAPAGDPGGAPVAGGGAPAAPAEPSVIDLDDEKLIRIKGQEKPVKFGEHVKGFQSQFTKASQRAAQMERQLQQERQAREHYQRQAEQAAQAQRGHQEPDVYGALKQLPYLSGEDAAGVVQYIAGEMSRRDQIILGALKEVKALKESFSGIRENHSNQVFEGKISKFLKDKGLGPEWSDIAKTLYVAYEGNDLDEQFPQIFDDYLSNLRRNLDAERQQKLDAANRQRVPFVPGRGATVGPTKPLEIKPDASAKEVADQLWGHWNGTQT